MKRFSPLSAAVLFLAGALSVVVRAQGEAEAECFESVAGLIERHETDRNELSRFYGGRVLSESHAERLEKFYDEWAASLEKVDFDGLSQAERIDYLLMRHRLEYRKKSLATDLKKLAEIEALVGFKEGVLELHEGYRQRGPMEGRPTAERLEESGARSEVRRFVGDSYSPLYQCGYMIGGLQLRALYKQTVGEGTMSPREFHDAVLKMGPIPIEMVRATLLEKPLSRDYTARWDF